MSQPLTAAVRYLSGEREPVRVATTDNVILNGLQVIDDVELEVGDRVLVKDQTDQTQNGIYLASEGRWPRAPDASYTRAINEGVTVQVREGTLNNGKAYRFSTSDPRVGTDPIHIQFYLSSTFSEDAAAIVASSTQAINEERDAALFEIEQVTSASLAAVDLSVADAMEPFIISAEASATEAAMYAEMVGAAVYDFNFDSDPSTPGYDWND